MVFGLAMGMGACLPQPTGIWVLQVDGRRLLHFTFTKHDAVWRTDGASFAIQVKNVVSAPPGGSVSLDPHTDHESSACFGLGVLRIDPDRVKPGEPLTVEIRAAGDRPSMRWCRLDHGSAAKKSRIPGYGTLSELNYWQGLLLATGNSRRPRVSGYEVCFGDLHTHSALNVGGTMTGDGTGSPEENFLFARDVGRLDFYALSEHEWQIDSEGWAERNQFADRFDESGRFVTIPAFEWGRAYGQRCVYYEKSHQSLASTESGATTPTQLWNRLRAIDGRAITIAHHPSWAKVPVDWNYYDPEFDRLMEIYSVWGSSEHDDAPNANKDTVEGCCFRQVLARGYRLGCIASSDGHEGHPGVASATQNHAQLLGRLGSGRVAVLATDLTRQSVFDALYDRRCYATTGEPIVLDFQVSGMLMGGEIPATELTNAPDITVHVLAPLPVRTIEIIRDGRIAHVQHADTREASASFRDAQYEGGAAYYYARVTQDDGETAWSSPVWIVP